MSKQKWNNDESQTVKRSGVEALLFPYDRNNTKKAGKIKEALENAQLQVVGMEANFK
jgi:hypothetical protein